MTLPDRMRAAADTLEELSAHHGYRFPTEAGPNWDNCSGALADMGEG